MKHGKVYVIAAICALGTVTAGVSVLRAQAPSPATRAPERVMRALPSEHSVMLADGRTFRLQGPAGRALVSDPRSPQRSVSLPLPETRIGSALVSLPDGRLLVWSGLDASGVVLADGLWFDPRTSSFAPAKLASLPRGAGQSMTLLMDGRVLVAGGWNADSSAPDVSVLRPDSDTTEPVDATGVSVDMAMDASLRSDGAVLLKDGGGVHDGTASAAAAFLPASMTFDRGAHKDPVDFAMSGSLPLADATNVSASAPVALRFSGKIDPATATSMTVTLVGPAGSVLADVNIAEEGRLAFIKPHGDLLTGTKYAVVLQGIKSADGRVLPFTTFGFQTSALAAGVGASSDGAVASNGSSSITSAKAGGTPSGVIGPTTYTTTGLGASGRALGAPAGCSASARPLVLCRPKSYLDNGVFYPGQDNAGETGNGQWRLNSKESISSTEVVAAVRSLRKAGHGKLTARTVSATDVGDVSGNVALIDGTPVVGASISYGEQRVRTDVAGYFVLKGLKTGHQTLFVDGTGVAVEGGKLGEFVAGVDIAASTETRLPYRLYMPKIIARDRIRLASPTLSDIVVTHPDLPGLEVRIPKGTVIRDHAGKVVTELSIVPMPVDRAPTPAAGNFPMYFSLQPGGATVQNVSPDGEQGVSITYPNYSRAPAGAAAEFYVYRPDNGWTVYGTGVVTNDGRQVKPESGVTLNYLMSGSYGLSKQHPADDNPTVPCGACAADPVDLRSGTFLEEENDIVIKDVIPLTLSRQWHDNAYHPLDQRMFGGWRSNYDMYVQSPNADFSAPIVRLPNGNGMRFTQIATRSGDTYTWQYTGDRSEWYGSILETVSYNDRCGAIIECYLLTRVDGTEFQFTNSYPSNGAPSQLTFIRDRYHNQLAFTWNAGLLQQITSASGRFITLSYDQYNNVSSATDNSGRTWTYAYHREKLPTLVQSLTAKKIISAQVSSADDPLSYAYFLDSVIYPDGSVKKYGYQDDYVTPAGPPGSAYNVPGTLLTVTDRNGKIMLSNTYESGTTRVVEQTRADGSAYKIAYVGAMNDPSQVQVTDPLGSVRAVNFSPASGYPVSETRAFGTPLAQTTLYNLTASGQIASQVDALGRKTAFEYDATGHVTKRTRLADTASAVSSRRTWSQDFGLPLTTTDELGHTTKYSYVLGCLTSITDATGRITTIVCNGQGEPEKQTDPAGDTTTFEYEGLDLSKITDPAGRATSIRVDSLGRPTATVDGAANTTQFILDTNDRTTATVSAQGERTSYTYDFEGHLTGIRRANGATTEFGYNALYMRTVRTDASGRSETWSYDALGNLTEHVARSGKRIGYGSVDALGRFTSFTDADGKTVSADVYDGANRLLRVSDTSSGAIDSTFDDLDRLTSETYDGRTISYSWYVNGARKSMTPAGQLISQYTYDDAGRPKSITQGGDVVAFSYDAAGRRSQLVLPNGVASDYTYDDAGNVASISFASKGVRVGDLTYAYGPSGLRTESGGSFAPSVVDAATSQANQFDENAREVATNGSTLTYDADGNMTSDGSRTYAWNSRGQLSRVSVGATAVAEYSYDARGRRRSVKSSAGITSYDYDGLNVVAERAPSGVLPIMVGLGTDERYARGVVGQRQYFLTDVLGSVLALSDESGSVSQRYDYSAYGANADASSGANPFQYAGREVDATGLMYMRARYYSPYLKRFISEDPIRERGGLNSYAYVSGNPISLTDPLGLCEADRCKKVAEKARETCSDSSLPTRNYGYLFWRCVNDYIEENNCGPGGTPLPEDQRDPAFAPDPDAQRRAIVWTLSAAALYALGALLFATP